MLTDVNVESIGALTQLNPNIGGAIVSDVGMKILANMASLKSLDLSRMEITAQGLKPVTKMIKLQRLNLWQCARIDDKAAQHLLKMTSLEIVDLGDTAVTDKLLDDLTGMKSLKLLLVGGTKITLARVKQFRKARPDCRIVWAPEVQGSEVRRRYTSHWLSHAAAVETRGSRKSPGRWHGNWCGR